MLQGLPEIAIANSEKGLKQYWKNYVKPFQKNGDVKNLMSGRILTFKNFVRI